MRVGGVVEYMSDFWYWSFYHTEGQCGLWSTCQTPGTGSVTWYWCCYHTQGQCVLVE